LFNLSADRGLSSFHSEHRFVGSPIYALPLGKNQRWLKGRGTLAALAGNWRLSAITTLQTGKPFTVNRGMDPSAMPGGMRSLVRALPIPISQR